MAQKVLHLISGGDTGGAKTHIFSLMKYLRKEVDVKIICFIKDTFYEEAKRRSIPIEVFEQKNRTDMSIIHKLKEIIVDENYELVHCHGARANFAAYFLKKKVKIPFITTIHSDYKLDFKGNFYKQLIYGGLNAFALKKFSNFITISDDFKKMMVSRGFMANRIHVVYNGIDLREELNYVDKNIFLNRYAVKEQVGPIFGIAARLDRVKDIETFIKAANRFLANGGEATFLIAGSGPEKESLEAMIEYKERILLLGHVKDPYSLFNAIDVNVLTSISESFPYVILEAGRLRKPTISTDVGGIDKIVIPGKTGYLFDVKDSERLCLLFEECTRNMDQVKSMGEAMFNCIENSYSAEKMAKEHIKIYSEILEEQQVIE